MPTADIVELTLAAQVPPLPTVQVWPGHLARAVDELQGHLLAESAPVFVRGGCLVTPIWDESPTFNGAMTRSVTINQMSVAKLSYMIDKKFAKFVAPNMRRNLMVSIEPPVRVFDMLLNAGHWKLRKLAGVINAPTLRPDGSLVSRRGYDARTRLWLDWEDNFVLPEFSMQPSKADAIAAKKLLEELLQEFRFADPELDKAIALSAILTAVLRGAFDFAPMFLIAAPSSASGKSYFANVVANIITGRDCPVFTLNRNSEESEKRIGAMLLSSPAIISLDNLSGDLDGELLCQMCTQRFVKVRILGKSEMQQCEWRGMLFGTGNNVELVGDMARRGLTCHINTRVERPELRKFSYDPVAEVLNNRGKFIAAALQIALAYHCAGRPKMAGPLAGFTGWSAMVRDPLLWLECADPVSVIDRARVNDPARANARELVRLLKKQLGPDLKFTVARLQTIAGENWTEEFAQLLLTECSADMRRNEINSRRLANWLRRLCGQVFEIFDDSGSTQGNFCIEVCHQKTTGHIYELARVTG
jgi:putative DNA primase/helicase